MDRIVGAELGRIPRDETIPQRELRMLYNARRRASLGRNAGGRKSAGDVLTECVEFVWSRRPEAILTFDASFFGVMGYAT